jgi:hypothetical protein
VHESGIQKKQRKGEERGELEEIDGEWGEKRQHG